MKYPKLFVDEVKAEYPDWEKLHRALDMGDMFVGRYLDDSSTGGFRPEHVVKMINDGHVAQLKSEAEKQIRRIGLYHKWCEIYQTQQVD